MSEDIQYEGFKEFVDWDGADAVDELNGWIKENKTLIIKSVHYQRAFHDREGLRSAILIGYVKR